MRSFSRRTASVSLNTKTIAYEDMEKDPELQQYTKHTLNRTSHIDINENLIKVKSGSDDIDNEPKTDNKSSHYYVKQSKPKFGVFIIYIMIWSLILFWKLYNQQ